jgi:hypothetical protein
MKKAVIASCLQNQILECNFCSLVLRVLPGLAAAINYRFLPTGNPGIVSSTAVGAYPEKEGPDAIYDFIRFTLHNQTSVVIANFSDSQ